MLIHMQVLCSLSISSLYVTVREALTTVHSKDAPTFLLVLYEQTLVASQETKTTLLLLFILYSPFSSIVTHTV
jgi:hypothetical protein